MKEVSIRGRSTQSNPKNRFEKLHVDFDDVNFSNEELESERKIPTEFCSDDSKSIIATNNSYDVGFNYSFNPYRGCEHGCIYCYARPTHEFLGFSSGLDFETKIMVKENAPELLEETFKNKNYKPDLIMFSGNTDCYQPIERKLELTRKSLFICLKYRNPVSIITKNHLIQRDVDVLKELSGLNLVTVMLSITTLDNELTRKMEPRTAAPEKRMETIHMLSENNIPVGVNIAPVIPGLNDEEIPAILKEAAANGAYSAGHSILRLPYSVKDLFVDWLKREFPGKASKVINRIRDTRGGKLNESQLGKRMSGEGEFAETIHRLFNLSCEKYNLNKKKYDLPNNLFIRDFKSQMELF